jgi:hypothetical protein
VRRKHGQSTGKQSNRALSDDYSAIVQLLKGVVWQVEKQFGCSEDQIELLVNRGAVVSRPIHDAFELVVKLVGLVD